MAESEGKESNFFRRIIRQPDYGFTRAAADGHLEFYKPTTSEMFGEFFRRLNIFKSKKNWLPLFSWIATLLFVPFFILFFTKYFSWTYFALGFVYSMVLMGSHGTLYLHRFGTHRAYKVANKFVLFVIRNLVVKVIPEEIYIISHHTHHNFSEQPGDPYNVHGGWLYCFLADAIHQPIAIDLDENDYKKVTMLLKHTGVKVNTYRQYQTWGSLAHPLRTFLHYLFNWSFWAAVCYAFGGIEFLIAMFGMAGVWAVGIRTFNYGGHGGGKDKRQDGIDFARDDLSINQIWPGFVAGEWHNNHHLYASGARSGFLPYQIDLPWYFIKALHSVGAITSYIDPKEEFLEKHYRPYLVNKKVVGRKQPL